MRADLAVRPDLWAYDLSAEDIAALEAGAYRFRQTGMPLVIISKQSVLPAPLDKRFFQHFPVWRWLLDYCLPLCSRPPYRIAMSDHLLQRPALFIDFTRGAVEHRRRFGGGRGQALARAVGMKPGVTPAIVDATAGLGRDSFLLATLGAEVTMIERNDVIHALLADALARAYDLGGVYRDIVGRMCLVHGDAISLLSTLEPSVVLVDPMHPQRSKSALVKAEMRQVRSIVGTDDDKAMLITAAIAAATKRAVVKWPAKLPLPAGVPAASHQISGKTTRYDVFVRHRH